MKICTKCATAKEIVEFSKCKTTKDGLQRECKECWAKRARDHYSSNSILINEQRAQARKNNPDIARSRDAKYYASNVEKVAQYSAIYYQNNKENRRGYSSEWSKRNPDARSVITQNRRARKRTNGGTLSRGLTAKLFKLQKGKCACCKQALESDYHMDHIMPIALGGANADDNMQLLRAKCNLNKSAKHPVDFMQERGFLL